MRKQILNHFMMLATLIDPTYDVYEPEQKKQKIRRKNQIVAATANWALVRAFNADANDTYSYTMKQLKPSLFSENSMLDLISEKKEFSMSGDYSGHTAVVDVLYWTPDKKWAFIYLPFRNPVMPDSYFWVGSDTLQDVRQVPIKEDWQLGEHVQAHIYTEQDKWMWVDGEIQSVLADKCIFEVKLNSKVVDPEEKVQILLFHSLRSMF